MTQSYPSIHLTSIFYLTRVIFFGAQFSTSKRTPWLTLSPQAMHTHQALQPVCWHTHQALRLWLLQSFKHESFYRVVKCTSCKQIQIQIKLIKFGKLSILLHPFWLLSFCLPRFLYLDNLPTAFLPTMVCLLPFCLRLG